MPDDKKVEVPYGAFLKRIDHYFTEALNKICKNKDTEENSTIELFSLIDEKRKLFKSCSKDGGKEVGAGAPQVKIKRLLQSKETNSGCDVKYTFPEESLFSFLLKNNESKLPISKGEVNSDEIVSNGSKTKYKVVNQKTSESRKKFDNKEVKDNLLNLSHGILGSEKIEDHIDDFLKKNRNTSDKIILKNKSLNFSNIIKERTALENSVDFREVIGQRLDVSPPEPPRTKMKFDLNPLESREDFKDRQAMYESHTDARDCEARSCQPKEMSYDIQAPITNYNRFQSCNSSNEPNVNFRRTAVNYLPANSSNEQHAAVPHFSVGSYHHHPDIPFVSSYDTTERRRIGCGDFIQHPHRSKASTSCQSDPCFTHPIIRHTRPMREESNPLVLRQQPPHQLLHENVNCGMDLASTCCCCWKSHRSYPEIFPAECGCCGLGQELASCAPLPHNPGIEENCAPYDHRDYPPRHLSYIDSSFSHHYPGRPHRDSSDWVERHHLAAMSRDPHRAPPTKCFPRYGNY